MLQDDFPRLVAFCDRCKDEFFANLPEKTDPTESSPFFSNPFSAPKEWFKNTFLTASSSSSSSTSTNGNGADASGKEGGKKSQEERDFDLKRIYAITFGTLAMVTYVIVNGLVVIGNEEEEEEEEEVLPISSGY